ncbi:MAG: hypothetical protein JWM78_393 [Verrucomicrobiaceae bacterium]|nr:hypothetical protein [Verrucomicrobiaceae bacterium]
MQKKWSAILFVIAALLMSAMSRADITDGQSRPVTFITDSLITTKIKTKLAADYLVSAMRLSVYTENDGVVWLKGVASTQVEADRAVAIARSISGVSEVNSEIKVHRDK